MAPMDQPGRSCPRPRRTPRSPPSGPGARPLPGRSAVSSATVAAPCMSTVPACSVVSWAEAARPPPGGGVPQEGHDGGQELLPLDRLDQVGVGPPLQPGRAVPDLDEGGRDVHHGDGQVPLLDVLEDLEPAGIGQVDVEDGQVRQPVGQDAVRLGPGAGLDNLEASPRPRPNRTSVSLSSTSRRRRPWISAARYGCASVFETGEDGRHPVRVTSAWPAGRGPGEVGPQPDVDVDRRRSRQARRAAGLGGHAASTAAPSRSACAGRGRRRRAGWPPS